MSQGNIIMVPFQKEVLINGILFFAKAYYKKTKKYPAQMYLYKFLAFVDFESVQQTGEPVFGLQYIAMEKGPVPKELYDNRENIKNDLFRFVKKDNAILIIPDNSKQVNFEYFSEYEIDLFNKWIEIIADRKVLTKDVSLSSHEINAWKKTYKKKPNSIISYKDVFDIIPAQKELSPVEEHFLIYSSIHNIK